ncbi:hypothetical protein F4821DRAFT_129517 [Hypoxylon rubiginosum]|uniref:Uncharacterized protein n=1 Tax=Hypoxylon rubiginosum TaxID=110542 RepID=A0ACC0D101_9PEZI|nr:hypothetical protein F4821DRAFT_129517 [Hypoxylon rubiginosum]
MALNKPMPYSTRLYRAVGFTKGYNFYLWLLLSLGLGGFVLMRLKYLDLYGTFCGSASGGRDLAVPGECFYHLQPGRYQIGIMVHLACILPASALALSQFVPAFRRRALWLHRINGYIATVLCVAATIGVLAILRRTMGGGIDTQSMTGLLAIIVFYSSYKGIVSARRHQIEQHRAWMLRAWVNAGAIVTMRVILITSSMILSFVGDYYYVEPCAKINFILQGENATLARYPECAPFFSGEDPNRHIAVKADVIRRDKVAIGAMINMVFGMSGWLAIAIHAFGVELYLHLTSTERRTAKSVKLQQNGVDNALKAD